MAELDLATGRLEASAEKRPGHQLGSPRVAGDRVYVSDRTDGDVVVVEVSSRRALPMSPHVADGEEIELIADDDENVWVNVPEAGRGYRIDDRGRAEPIFGDPGVPQTASPETAPPPSSVPSTTATTRAIPPPLPPSRPPVEEPARPFGPTAGVIYAIDDDGRLFWYRHLHPGDGAGGFANGGRPTPIGVSFGGFTHVFSGGDGIIYAIDREGRLNWYRHLHPGDGAGGFANGGRPTPIGVGFSAPRWFAPPA